VINVYPIKKIGNFLIKFKSSKIEKKLWGFLRDFCFDQCFSRLVGTAFVSWVKSYRKILSLIERAIEEKKERDREQRAWFEKNNK
jgi:hypothetical protein